MASNSKNIAELLSSDGQVEDAKIDGVSATKLTGTIADARFPSTLPALSGANLTNIDAATVGTSAPSSPAQGDLWFDTTTGVTAMKVYSGSLWVQVSNKITGTGGTVTTYSSGGVNYKVHTFTSSGAFTAGGSGLVDALVIAGGGSGDYAHAGGGGAGGHLETSSFNLNAGTYNITIGAGGAGHSSGVTGNNGNNSVLGTLVAIGGGGGGGNSGNGLSGGSGGGSGERTNLTSGAAGTTGQGNAGGGATTSYGGAGGGGGAGQVGEKGDTPGGRPGNGGNGLASSITGSAVTRAGGGGGGGYLVTSQSSGGSGGGGVGGGNQDYEPGAGAINTGGGSGGGGQGTVNQYTTSKNGGSGIVIIRYAI